MPPSYLILVFLCVHFVLSLLLIDLLKFLTISLTLDFCAKLENSLKYMFLSWDHVNVKNNSFWLVWMLDYLNFQIKSQNAHGLPNLNWVCCWLNEFNIPPKHQFPSFYIKINITSPQCLTMVNLTLTTIWTRSNRSIKINSSLN